MEFNLNNLFQRTTVCLVAYLERTLPPLFEDWWKQAVLNSLSFQQQRRIEQRNLSSLAALDLAALLRVLDQNWYQISSRLDLTSEARHFVKEMQTIRNRWAHATTEGFPVEDVYRDLDTLQRFAAIIEADDALLQEIRATKTDLLAIEIGFPGYGESIEQRPHQENKKHDAEFELGQIVSVKSNPTIRGAVISVLPGKPENRFKVFVDGKAQTYYASQLQNDDLRDDDAESLPCEQFHAHLTALQIRYPGLSTLYSLNAARVDFIPYQFRPVLRFIRSDRPRLLIADGVGVGKTIEAGLILRELQARRDIRSVLVICPRPLITECKWQNEMKRFEERFTHLDGGTLRYCINEMDREGVWPEQHQRVIVPYSLFDENLLYGSGTDGKRKRKKGLLDLDPPPRFDLVIVDEAHHIRNQDTFSHKAVRFFCDHAEAVVFTTATPIQLGSYDLFVLLNTLRPDLIIDQESFEHMAEPNPFINQAVSVARSQGPEWPAQTLETLDKAAATAWGRAILRRNPEFIRIHSRLAEGNVTNEERVQFITDIEAMHTFAGIINRTRRRDIGEFTMRKPETVVVGFTPAQQHLHDELLRVQTEIFSRIHGDVNVKFMMTTIRRQAASCLYGLAPFLDEILNRHLDELSWDEADNSELVPQGDVISSIRSQIQAILESARSLDPHDPKLDTLSNIIRDKQSLSNNKVMLFSSFRHTLQYLYTHLSADGFRVGMIHGGTPDEERVELRARFEKPKEGGDSLDLLLFSEIGCEGLDYQFCDCIVNYDLPWNPMRVEQRIGRIDRVGQKSESIAIVNMITPGTVDADIYERCLVRIGVFNSALGGSEEILGEITREIRSIAEQFSLSDEERGLKFQQLADNKIRLIQEQEILEQRQLELFGIRLPENQIKKEIEDASSFWLSSASIHRLVTLYLQRTCGKEQDFILGEKPLKTLRLSQDARSSLLRDFQQLPRQNTTAYREWENWLKGGNPHLLVTFESGCAMQHSEAAFIMPLHPLVKQAAMVFDTRQRVITTLKVQAIEVPAGRYEFAIYQWRFHGIKEDLVLRPIASTEAVTAHLGHLLKKAVDATVEDPGNSGAPVWGELDAQHYTLWSEARAKHRQRTQELAEYRRESLSTSHRARMALLEEQLNQANNDKIQKMRQSQIATAETDYARRIQDLDIAMERADVIAEPVAYGVLSIEDSDYEHD
ncbi:MAG: helicase [Syntrophus sp. (in: bacteria)]|nr:helicase [Syntrophus sp. (in: bacteria)]